MITDKTLLTIAIICAISGIIGLSLIPVNNENTLLNITIIKVNEANNDSFIEFLINTPFSGYTKGNISKGEYLITGTKGGNDFYYISSFKKINGPN